MIHSSKKLRFKRQGGPGQGSGSPRDAIVEVTVKPHPNFTRTGHVLLKVPPGTSTGSRLRIRGKGVGGEKQRGDQIVIAKIALPKTLGPDFQEARRNLDSKFSYNPRDQEEPR